ncbi:MAG TPA: hypothetical protein DE147_12945, partial [Gammaproteobacteria bacterium]|nr:hypothetical protein [Gammaproteobacteria bacterium]
MRLTPLTRALMASCRRAIDLLPGRVISASNPEASLGIVNERSGIISGYGVIIERHSNPASTTLIIAAVLVGGEGEQAMSNFFAQLEQAFVANADSPALLLASQQAWHYADLLQQINRVAFEFLCFGVSAGDRVLVQLPKSPENLALYLACLKLGLVYVPLNTAYTEAELDYFVSDAEPVLYVGEQSRQDVACATLQTREARCLLVFSDSAANMQQVQAADGPAAVNTVSRSSEDLAAILYTSGTT